LLVYKKGDRFDVKIVFDTQFWLSAIWSWWHKWHILND